MTDETPQTPTGTLVRRRRQAMRMSIDGLAARLGPLVKTGLPATGIYPDGVRQLENAPHLVHLGGYASVRIAAALELPLGRPSPLLKALLGNLADALRYGYVSVRAATRALHCTQEALQEAFDLSGINHTLYQ